MSSHWNYRVIDIDGFLGIHEVYYRDDIPRSYTVNPVPIVGENILEIMSTISHMSEALIKPILTDKDFPEEQS
jgi:hypothetical protein